MSDDLNVDGVNDSAGGAADKSKKNSVSYETYSRILDEVKNLKEKVKLTDEQNRLANENKLKEQNDWKALAEAKEAQLLELKNKHVSLESSVVDNFKLSAFQKQLGGKLRSDKYFDFVDTSKIVFNPETKKVDDDSVKAVVAEFIKEHSHLVEFKSGKMPKSPNGNGLKGDANSGVKTIETMSSSELEKEILRLHNAGILKDA